MKAALLILVLVITAGAQSLPRWPSNTAVRLFVLAGTFDADERKDIDAAVESWRPLLPAGVTLQIAGETSEQQTCRNCVTIIRESVADDERGQCKAHHRNGITDYAVIRIDPRTKKFRGVVEHEIGHLLGLDHYAKSVMQAKESNRHPAEIDGERLRAIYALPMARTLWAHPAATRVSVEAAMIVPFTTTAPVQRYSFKRVVTKGKLRRESVFIWNDQNELIETEIVGSNDKAFRSIPMFPVGTSAEAVFSDWRTRPAVNKYGVSWRDGKSLSIDGAGDETLIFPTVAHRGKIRVTFEYKLFRVDSTIREIEP